MHIRLQNINVLEYDAEPNPNAPCAQLSMLSPNPMPVAIHAVLVNQKVIELQRRELREAGVAQ